MTTTPRLLDKGDPSDPSHHRVSLSLSDDSRVSFFGGLLCSKQTIENGQPIDHDLYLLWDYSTNNRVPQYIYTQSHFGVIESCDLINWGKHKYGGADPFCATSFTPFTDDDIDNGFNDCELPD